MKNKHWRSKPVYTNCYFFAIRQIIRRGGYLSARKIDVAYGRSVSSALFACSIAFFLPGWWPLGATFLLHAPLFLFHWGWRPGRKNAPLYHFRPDDIGATIPWIFQKGYIQRGEDYHNGGSDHG